MYSYYYCLGIIYVCNLNEIEGEIHRPSSLKKVCMEFGSLIFYSYATSPLNQMPRNTNIACHTGPPWTGELGVFTISADCPVLGAAESTPRMRNGSRRVTGCTLR